MNSKLGVIFGNRNFFPDQLVSEAREEMDKLLNEMEIHGIMLSEEETKLGGVETYQDAQKCAGLFKQHHESIEGILVVLPNFGDEKGISDAIRLSGLDVPFGFSIPG